MKEEAMIEVRDEVTKLPPYARVMKVWASWMTLKDRSTSGGYSHPQDAKEFMRTGEAVDTMVRSLPRVNRWAVDKAHGISTVWIFPNISLADVMLENEKILSSKMRNHADTMRFFRDE